MNRPPMYLTNSNGSINTAQISKEVSKAEPLVNDKELSMSNEGGLKVSESHGKLVLRNQKNRDESDPQKLATIESMVDELSPLPI